MATRVLPQRTSGIAGFCAPVLQALEGGMLIRTLVAAFMRIEAVVVLLGMLALAFGIGKNAFNGERAQQITAMIVLAVMRVLFRHGLISDPVLSSGKCREPWRVPFTVIPIVSICFRSSAKFMDFFS